MKLPESSPPEPPKVMVVDDHEPSREFLSDLLSLRDYTVVGTSKGSEAVALAEAEQPDLILLDVLMPEMDGFAVCKLLKASPSTRAIPILFMTALRKTTNKVRGFAAGAVDYLIKPLENAEVLARVQTHLSLRQLQKQLEAQNRELEQRVAERTAELAQLNKVYERFVPREFISHLEKKSILEVQLGDHVNRQMTVMFADVHGWTMRSEQSSPEQSFQLINEYFSVVSPIIRAQGGFIDQYYGDGVMALFAESADQALRAAIDMFRALSRWQGNGASEAMQIGIGLHTGNLALGILGEAERMQGAVVSDDVNLASRMEGLTRIFDARILISDQTYQALEHPTDFGIRFLDKVRVKGRAAPVGVYEVYMADPPAQIELKQSTRAPFESGLKHYFDRRFSEAQAEFQLVLEVNPGDIAAQRHLDKAAEMARNGVPDDWDGVSQMTQKG